MKRQVRRITRRNQGRSIEEVRDELNPFIRGWVNYFALANAKMHMQALDEWMRRRLRQVVMPEWRRPVGSNCPNANSEAPFSIAPASPLRYNAQ